MVHQEVTLQIKNLEAGYVTKQGTFKAVDQVSFDLKKGEFLGIAGESGCGKSTLAYAIMNLLEDNGQVFSGEMLFEGQNLAALTTEELKKTRWVHISMVFQSAMNALNPVITVK